jgi:TonB family protein
VSCSSSERAPLQGLTPRLGAALAASIVLHALLVGGLEAPFGARGGSISWFSAGAPIRAVLRDVPISVESGTERAASAAETSASARPGPGALLPKPRYYLTRELDVRPGITTRVEPEYPEAAARRALSGKVVLRIYIDESGAVERAVALRADPPGVFEQAAERAFLAARFTPGLKGGHPVRVQMTLEVTFESAQAPAAE